MTQFRSGTTGHHAGRASDRTERVVPLPEKTERLLSTPTQPPPQREARAPYLPKHTLDWTLDGVRVLERAFWLLQQHGWKQGVGDGSTQLTLDQAVQQAFDDMDAEGLLLESRFAKTSALSSLAGAIFFIDEENGDTALKLETLKVYVPERPWGVVARFNDDPGRRYEDISSLICEAISNGWKANRSMWQHRRDRAITQGTNFSMWDLSQD